MSRFITLIGDALHLLGLALFLLIGSTPAWAAGQRPVAVSAEAEADWVLSYALVILCIGLAVFAVCRPGRRGRDIRRPA